MHDYLVPSTSRNPTNPCVPSPCGPNSQCKVAGTQAACSCIQNYKGRPPNCRPECTLNAECPSNLACKNEQCIDPCPGSCGTNALCSVVTHNSVCTCVVGYEGDPTTNCIPITSKTFFSFFYMNCSTKYVYIRIFFLYHFIQTFF